MSDPAGVAVTQAAEEVVDLTLYLDELAATTADHARDYLDALEAVASGDAPDTTLPVLLLAVSQVLFTGAQLGALADVEADPPRASAAPEVVHDGDPLREGLARVLHGLDEYADLVDPLTSAEVVRGVLSDDLADVAAALSQGLRHFDEGRALTALWWWQFSYLSDWGERAAAALRVLHSVFAHLRLDRAAPTPVA
jgi:hypothetical protein